jgi:hypothetical protein
MKPSKTIVDKRPRADEDSPIFVKEVLQKSRDINLPIPIEDEFLGSQVVSFNVKLKNSKKSVEEIVRETAKPEEVRKAKLLNSFGGGTTYEEEIARMERSASCPINC